MASRLRIRAQKFVLRLLAERGILVLRKSKHDRTRQQELTALVHAVCAAEGAEIPPRPDRLPLLAGLVGTSPAEAAFLIIHLHRSLHAAGDVCEFGVGSGATSALLANEIAPTERTLWLYDSFAGLPKPSAEDVLIDDFGNLGSMLDYEGKLAHRASEVLARLERLTPPFSRHRIVAGMFRDSPETEGPEAICFAYVDFDFYHPIRDALTFVDARLSPGGTIVVDDYAFFSAGAQRAVDEFVAARGAAYDFRVAHQDYGHFCMLRRRAA